MMTELIGWASSALLLVTLSIQIHKQWKLDTQKGVSKWLFIGQLASSIGFTAYSVATGNTVFIITNACLAVSAIVGIYIYFSHVKRKGEEAN